jgi:hypothetical protein
MSPNRKSLATTASDQIRAIIEAAEQTAAQIRDDAVAEAAQIRSQAEEEASAIRSDARGDVQELLESLREGVSRLSADVDRLGEKLRPAEPAPAKPAAAAKPATPEPLPPTEPVTATAPDQSDGDLEGARLVALNMALDGASRDEVDRYLSENFELSDHGPLLDDVFASIGG